INVLEVEGKLFSRIARFTSLHQFIGILNNGAYINDEALISLVCRLLPIPFGLDDHTHIFALLKGIDIQNRSIKVSYIETTLKISRNVSVDKIHQNLFPLLPNI